MTLWQHAEGCLAILAAWTVAEETSQRKVIEKEMREKKLAGRT